MSDLNASSAQRKTTAAASWDEADRLRALKRYQVVDTPAEADFDDLVQLAAQLCHTSAAAISLVTEDRQWFKAEVGLGIRETHRNVAFCAHAIHQSELFVVPDATQDLRFSGNPLVTGDPQLRFYAGARLETPQGLPLGTLCVLDFKPRAFSEQDAFVLRTLAAQVMTQLELRRALREQRSIEARQNCLLRLSDRLRESDEVQPMVATTLELLAQALPVQRLEFIRMQADDTATLDCEWRDGRLRARGLAPVLRSYDAKTMAALRHGEACIGETTVAGAAPASAQIAVPIIKQGRLFAVLWAQALPGSNEWTEADAALLREAAARACAAIERLLAEQALRNISEDLERQVKERTADLSLANARLTGEMAERQRSEAQLRQMHKMEAVGQLTSGIAHDFNNMLGGIIGGLELMQKRVAAGRFDQLDALLESTATSAFRGATMTQRLLSFSRRQALDPKPVEVNQLVTSMNSLLQRTLGESIRFEARLAEDVWNALADENQLESVLLNLVINARDAMPAGGKLIVESANVGPGQPGNACHADVDAGEYVVLTVRDDGCGMTPETLSRAFDPFFTTKRIGEGTGLGLSMVYGFARQSGGHVFIDSTIGVGTSICLYLPRHMGEEPDAPPPPQLAVEASSASATILVVDDDDGIRSLLVEILRELEYQVIEAADGHAALAHLQSGSAIDLLITDVGLPGVNGREVARIGRTLHPALKILMITGYGDNELLRKQQLEPGTELMSKPFSLEALAAKVGKMMAAGPAGRRTGNGVAVRE